MTTKLSVVCHILWWIVVQIRASIASRGLVVVGWYHSHPYSEPRPSQNDVLSHKKYQDALTNKSGEEPCVGLIISETLSSSHKFKSHVHVAEIWQSLLYGPVTRVCLPKLHC